MEKALFISKIKDISDDIDRIYYGNEFCQNLIPSLYQVKKYFNSVQLRKKNFTFVTPYVTNEGLKKLDKIFIFLNMHDNIEIVFNDWGVLSIIRENFSNLIPVMGRLLIKQHKDPRILAIFSKSQKKTAVLNYIINDSTDALYEHYKSVAINSATIQNLLSLGVTRIEIDNLIWNMKININMRIPISIYLPYGYIATSRKCGKLTLTYSTCKYECKKYFLQIREGKYLSVPLYIAGNTIFYKSTSPANSYLKKLNINRIIYQKNLPFSDK